MADCGHEITKERIYLFSPAACILMQVTFRQTVSVDALQSAIGRAAARQATLCSRAQLRADGSAFFVPCEPAPPHLCRIEPMETPETVIRREMRTPFAIEQGEWMRHSIAETDGKTVWFLACHHMAGDGRSLLYFIEDVAAALREPALTWDRQAFFALAAQDEKGSLSAPMRWGLRVLNRQWEKTKRVFSPEDRARITEAYWADRFLCMAHATVGKRQLENLLQACRRHRVTLTSAWLAAVLLSTTGVMDAGIAVDIRPDGFTGMANLATGIGVRCARRGELWSAAQTIHRRMRQMLADGGKRDFLLHFLRALSPTLIDAAYFAAYDGLESGAARRVSVMFGYDGHPKSCSVTNLLRAPLRGDTVERIAFYPPMVPNAKRLFGMVTTGGTLEITLQSFAGEPEPKALLDAVTERLYRACEA